MDNAGRATFEVVTEGDAIVVRVPLVLRKIGGRKRIVSPDGRPASLPSRPRINGPLAKAVVRAFHWQSPLEEGKYASVTELAKANKMNPSYVAHVVRLTLLAPDLVTAILDGGEPETLQLQPLLRHAFPVEWDRQCRDLTLA